MAPWPFGRKTKKQKKSAGNVHSIEGPRPSVNHPSSPNAMETAAVMSGAAIARQSSMKARNGKQKKLRKDKQDFRKFKARSLPPGVEVAPSGPGKAPEPYTKKSSYTNNPRDVSMTDVDCHGNGRPHDGTFQKHTSQSSLQPENFTAVPLSHTLHDKRTTADSMTPHRKLSKRKAEDYAREQELKALCRYASPKRSASRKDGGLFRRSSRNLKAGQHSQDSHDHRPMSQVSYPVAASMNSSLSGISESIGFKVNSFDVFAPRPTIRYSDTVRYGPARSLEPSRASGREKKPVWTEEIINESKNIDSLADDMDTSSLREIMERDKRRKEKRKRLRADELQRKLAQSAEEQREEARQRLEGHIPGNGLGFEGMEVGEPSSRAERPAAHAEASRASSPNRIVGSEDLFADSPTSREPLPEETKPALLNPVPGTAPYQSSHLSYSTHDVTVDILEQYELESASLASKRESETSSRHAGGWAAFFRRNASRRAKRTTRDPRFTPSSFENTSRESFRGQLPPAHLTGGNVRKNAAKPVRTYSRFREDLPELPISPPDSRVQSPEAARDASSRADRASSSIAENISFDWNSKRDSASRHLSMETGDVSASNAVVSQSLASVDSEGSWLSGKPMKRTSRLSGSALRESGSSLHHIHPFDDSPDEANVADDEYFRRLTPAPDTLDTNSSNVNLRASSTALNLERESSEESPEIVPVSEMKLEEPDSRVHPTLERKPTLVSNRDRAKSMQGLLNMIGSESESLALSSPEGDSSGFPESPDSPAPDSPENPESRDSTNSWVPERATSVNYGQKGHARQISAGSAKLLDLSPVASTEFKSTTAGESATPAPKEVNRNINQGRSVKEPLP